MCSSPWQHLRERDDWSNPGVTDEHCHLMVQMVEAWLMADPDALSRYYGQGFNANAILQNPDIEAVPKKDVADALDRATRHTQKGAYNKTRHCADLLKAISAPVVRKRARHCERLFSTVDRMISRNPKQ